MLIVLLAEEAANAGTAFLIWGIVLLALAIGLFAVELVVPSGGLIGMVAVVSLVGSLIAFFMYDGMVGIGAAAAYAIIGPVAAVFVFRLWLHSPLARRMILGSDAAGRTLPPPGADEGAPPRSTNELRTLNESATVLGSERRTEPALRPIGIVILDGRRVDAFSEHGIIEAGTPVIVVDAYDNQLKVRPRQPGAS